jgi:transcriptional regulator GlxA family with amidase domain
LPSPLPPLTKALLLYLAASLAQDVLLTTLQPARHANVCKDVLAYIHQHFSEKLTVPQIAAAVGISPTYFSAFFEAHFFQRFSEYLCNHRLEEAGRLLISTSLSVTEIALATGFSSGSHFIRRFREKHGTTPLAFRRKHRSPRGGA